MLRRGKEQEAAEASVNTIAVQQDWRDREFIASVQLGLSQLSAFLNDFGMRNKPCSLSLYAETPLASAALGAYRRLLSPTQKDNTSRRRTCLTLTFLASRVPSWADATTRGRLSALDGKLSRLERRMAVVEATLQSVDQGA